MKITSIDTIRTRRQPNLLFVELHTDEGVTGLGEAFFGARAVEAYLHESVAPVLLGIVDPAPEAISRLLVSYVGYQGAGAETRGNAAVDLAVWDLISRRAELALATMLGGPMRRRIPVYNTCAGPGYIGSNTRVESSNWGIDASTGEWEDLKGFFERPGELARGLLDDGITGMKIWPFDEAAEATAGTDIDRAGLRGGIAIVEQIRDAVGMDMRVMIELHGLWHRMPAARIIEALRPYEITWVEDPLRPDAIDALAALHDVAGIPLAVGETAVGRRGFLQLLASGSIEVATLDAQWTGGLTEARKVAALADSYAIPIAPHDCTGPVSLAACLHFVLSQPNGLIQETVRAFINTWYGEFTEGLPPIVDGQIGLPEGPGHGVQLLPGVRDRADVEVTCSSL